VVSAFLKSFAAWAGEQVDVHAVVLIGSQARRLSIAARFFVASML
jgi:hypothetical protein